MTASGPRACRRPGDSAKVPVPSWDGTAWFLPSGGACDKAKDKSF
ncbi:hypothetical protein STVIR_0041 [Streptomyces viridochromogenes Tue57]|uniref:Uncharacterized protein n=1 Tax=Streptomyces viridochromogenes Tue57 TaxID=1160705 RepID=L8PN26_STRVR|nr:hypothetical protein STVIR_0041 [Streptomyces viridochromogenes Tue57]